MEKSDVVPVHTKGNKHVLENYRPVPLLPISGKIFERLFTTAYLSSSLKTNCFKPNDSCIYQLLFIMKSINPLIMVMKSGLFSLIYQKHLIKFGTMD